MNKNIILSGGGDIEDTFKLDEYYFSLLKDDAKILYIPVALDKRGIGFESCYDWFSSVISAHIREDKYIDFTMLLEEDTIPNLNMYESIYIGGGNTYKLLDFIYNKNLYQKFVDYTRNGGIIYGGSAGAIVLGKDIRTVESENDNNYKKFEGLNLLDGKSVICHYTDSMDEKIFNIVKKIGSDVIAIPEDSGLILNQEGIKTVGSVFIFNPKHKRQL
jgi:dipeptidase E